VKPGLYVSNLKHLRQILTAIQPVGVGIWRAYWRIAGKDERKSNHH